MNPSAMKLQSRLNFLTGATWAAVMAVGAVLLLISRTMAMPVPDEVKKVVVFIFVSDDGVNVRPEGTGFFVTVNDRTTEGRVFGYLVTAKHVLKTADKKDWRKEIYLRMNKIDGTSETGKMALIPDGPDKNVFVHTDSTVDVAVIPALPDLAKFEAKAIGENQITTKEKFKQFGIREGSEVFFTGLFSPFLGQQKNYPIVRFGRVALVTEERIDFGGIKAELYLMETSAYGGNSGSPVFFYLGADRNPGSLMVGDPILELAGVMSGRFNEAIAVQTLQTGGPAQAVFPNLGIAGVVPAFKLHEILFSKELSDVRDKDEKKNAANAKPSPKK